MGKRITADRLEQLAPGQTIWDADVRGLGVRRRGQAGKPIFVFKYRSPDGRQRFMTIGTWERGGWSIDDARRRATELRDAVRLDRDPAQARDDRKAMLTVAELCDAYLEAAPTLLLGRARRPKKPLTLKSDASRIVRHVKPLLGDIAVDQVTGSHIETFMIRVAAGATAQREVLGKRAVSRVTGGRGQATRTVGLLGAIFSFAIKRGLRKDNPVARITRFADGKRERRLSDAEYKALGDALAASEGKINRFGLAAIRLLLLTGWRMGEVVGLRWAEIDLPRRTAHLGDTKTGVSVRPLARSVMEVLTSLPRSTSERVLPGGSRVRAKRKDAAQSPPASIADKPDLALQGLPRMWQAVRAKAALGDDVTLHVLRHSFASAAADLGFSDSTIAALIGHRRGGITARYTHAADAVLVRAADDVAAATLRLLSGDTQPADATVIAFPGAKSA